MAKRKHARNKPRHIAKTTLLVVGEGPDDQAFIKHMNQQFKAEGTNIRPTIMKESGGSPGNIIANTTRKYRDSDYDKRYIVLDSDIPIDTSSRKLAQKKGYEIILWSPICLEGALLETLNEIVTPSETSQQLKRRLHPMLWTHHTEIKAYSKLFPKAVLEVSRNKSIQTVRSVLTDTKL